MKQDKLSTGNSDLDALLGGGLERRVITQIYGEPASGKSTFCLMAAVECLKRGKSVIFIDTEGFSVDRFSQIAGEQAEELARHLYLFEPVDFDQQGLMIAESEDLLRAGREHPVDLIVMDSATALYRTDPEIGKDALRRLSHYMVKLLGLAKKYDVPALITNQIYMDVDRNRVAGLGGTALAHISKVIISLEKTDSVRRAVLQKHRWRPEGLSFDFVLTEEGIEKV